MTNSEQAIREFVDKWGFSQDKTDEGFLIDNDRTKQCLSDLTALISEHYYPKEKYDELLQQRDELRDKYSKLLDATSELLKSMKTDNVELKKSIAEMRINMAKEIAAIKNTDG